MLTTSRSQQAGPLAAPRDLELVSSTLARVPFDEAAISELRIAIRDYVRAQKSCGGAPEAVLARVKALVQSFPPSRWGSDYAIEIQRALMTVIVDWCISAYYDEH